MKYIEENADKSILNPENYVCCVLPLGFQEQLAYRDYSPGRGDATVAHNKCNEMPLSAWQRDY